MKILLYTILALSLVGCEAEQDQMPDLTNAPIEHERTLRYSVAADGSTMIQAIILRNGGRLIDVASGKDAVQSRGGFMRQIVFKDCGRVNFAATGKGRVQGIHTGRGMKPVCQIREWDGQWYIQ
ncbi:hypothetical protein ACLPJF_21400 [Pseudomonas vlassakiae]|uniref:hypothetical protein n=1 Tax=Pseudomonas TaxID=286 RepID=UPI001C2556A5|nr:hypothetical protein [Pseudomonas shirazica]